MRGENLKPINISEFPKHKHNNIFTIYPFRDPTECYRTTASGLKDGRR